VSIPVALAELAERIDEFGAVAYLITVGGDGLTHVVSCRARWDDSEQGELVVGAGSRTLANAERHPGVTLLWPAPPGAGYSLIVDGRARPLRDAAEPALAIGPTAAVLHRTPEGDPDAPGCITVLPAS
jgi:hypothetical protein